MIDVSLDGIGNLFTSAREAITGKKILDPIEKAKLDLQFQELENRVNQGQIDINKVEAAHDNLFVAGARPFILWVCGFSIAYTFLIQPIIEYATLLYGANIKTPELNTGELMNLTLAMLGLAGLRTYEKKNGVAREKL